MEFSFGVGSITRLLQFFAELPLKDITAFAYLVSLAIGLLIYIAAKER